MDDTTHQLGPQQAISRFKTRDMDLLDVLLYNKKATKKFLQTPFFQMFTDGSLDDDNKSKTFLAAVQYISNQFQELMYSRQATCSDSRFVKAFTEHFYEEFGHDELLAKRKNHGVLQDPILSAIMGWFSYQMYTRDNVEKVAIIHLVLEVCGEHYHKAARNALEQHVESDYFKIHEEEEEGHADLGILLLRDLDSNSYCKIYQAVKVAWKMMHAKVNRITELVQQA